MLARQALSSFRSGWLRAALVAAVILAIGYVLNVVLAWLQLEASDRLLSYSQNALATPVDTPGIMPTALLSLMFWHGVAVGVSIPVAAGDVPFVSSIEASVNLTFMLGFALTGYMLFRGGKWLADRKTEAGWLAGAAGIQVSIFYGIFMTIAAIGVWMGWSFEVPATLTGNVGESTTVHLQPSLLGAFAIPFLLAAFAATAGAVSGRLAPVQRWTRLTLAGISGGWRAAWLAVALGSIGFLIVAALNPDVTRAYLELAPGGGLTRALLVIGTLMIVPNIGTGIAGAAMGGSINLAALGDSCAVISYMQFPHGVAEPATDAACALPFALGPAPFQYLLFLLVPIAATFAGGWLAAQRAGATGAEDGAVAGAAIAIPYVLWLWLLALVARIGYSASAGLFPFELRVWIGPGLLSTVLLALVWGLGGGAVGGAFAARKASEPGIDPGPLAEDSVG
jgi:hypothetical protein